MTKSMALDDFVTRAESWSCTEKEYCFSLKPATCNFFRTYAKEMSYKIIYYY